MLFINTRPTERAKPLTKALVNADVSVIEIPLLEMIALLLSTTDQERLSNLARQSNKCQFKSTPFEKYDILVVVSPTAASMGLDQLSKLSENLTQYQSSLPSVIAVGEATAAVLEKQGIKSIVPKVSSNEGMLELSCIQKLTADSRVMIWRGQEGRALLIDELRQRDIAVDVIELYQRRLPKLSIGYLNKSLPLIKQFQPAIVLISSEQSLKNWQDLLTTVSGQHHLTEANFIYLTLGDRLSKKLIEQNLEHRQIANLDPLTILDTLKTKCLKLVEYI